MSPGGTREGMREDCEEERSLNGVALEQHCFTPCVPYIATERRTGELSAVPQVEVSEQHALQRRDVTCRFENGREGVVILRTVPGDNLGLLWGNSLLICPTCTAGLPVSFWQLYTTSFSSGMFWRAAMPPDGKREGVA